MRTSRSKHYNSSRSSLPFEDGMTSVKYHNVVDDSPETAVLVGLITPNQDERKTTEFRGVTLSTLRIRFDDPTGVHMDAGNVMLICEMHPYGTVNGAGKSAAVRTRIIID